jgi:hypothetical protein
MVRTVTQREGDGEAVQIQCVVLEPMYSRLQREDAFRSSMTEAERRWLRRHRSPEATRWNVLTDLSATELARGF